MIVAGADQRLNKFSRMILRSLLYLLPLLLFSQLLGQPEIDDQYPVKGARVVSAKIFKFQNHPRSGLDQLTQPALAAGSRIFIAGFYLCLVFLTAPHELFYSPLIGLPFSRAPPPYAAA
jgi:hypothetical protein